MGTFIERIRCGGMPAWAACSPRTGLGTVVQEGKQVIHVNGQDYLLETALRADVAHHPLPPGRPLRQPGLFRGQQRTRASHPVVATCGDPVHRGGATTSATWGRSARRRWKVAGMFVDMLLAGKRGGEAIDEQQSCLSPKRAAAYFRPGERGEPGHRDPQPVAAAYAVPGVLFQS